MSEHTHLDPQTDEAPDVIGPEPESKQPAATPEAVEDESTIGTGTSMALGCIAGTVLLIVFGLIFLLVSRFI